VPENIGLTKERKKKKKNKNKKNKNKKKKKKEEGRRKKEEKEKKIQKGPVRKDSISPGDGGGTTTMTRTCEPWVSCTTRINSDTIGTWWCTGRVGRSHRVSSPLL
jgi:hypothetical protein